MGGDNANDGDADGDDRNIYQRAAAGDIDDDEVEAYNKQREQEIQETIETLNEQQQQAVDALRESAQASLETETVTLPSGVDLDVRTRISPEVERLIDNIQEAEATGDLQRARRLSAEALAEMVESPEEYGDPDVWVVASQGGDAGVQWLGECIEIVTEPATPEGAREGNSNHSDGMPGRTTAKQSGWQRQR